MTLFNQANWKEALKSVFRAAATNSAYRASCLSNSRRAIFEVSDIDLPADVNVIFVEGQPTAEDEIQLPPFLETGEPDETTISQMATDAGMPRTH